MNRTHPILLLTAALAVSSCDSGAAPSPTAALGDARRGKSLSISYGCTTCHTIPGVAGAKATVGPPLQQLRERVYVGGRLNTPDNLMEFLEDPRAVDHNTPMPNVGVSRADARDLVAFLYTLAR